MLKFNERVNKEIANWERMLQQKRIETRIERISKRKEDNRRKLIIGDLVVKYFPEVSRFKPGTKAENIIEFKQLEMLLSILAADTKLMNKLKGEVNKKLSSEKHE